MPAGLPGTGVGGLFLILSALLMPLVELRRRVRGRTRLGRWRLVGRQTALAIGIVAGVAGGVWALYWALLGSSPTHPGASARSARPNLLGGLMPAPVAPVLITLVLLASIIIIAYTLRLILLVPARRGRQVVRPIDVEAPVVESCDSAAANDGDGHIALPASSKADLSVNHSSLVRLPQISSWQWPNAVSPAGPGTARLVQVLYDTAPRIGRATGLKARACHDRRAN
jgi:hypothetical protein